MVEQSIKIAGILLVFVLFSVIWVNCWSGSAVIIKRRGNLTHINRIKSLWKFLLFYLIQEMHLC